MASDAANACVVGPMIGRQAAEITRATLTRVERRWRSIVGEDWPQLRLSLADIAIDSVANR
jgi:hypothetical protein